MVSDGNGSHLLYAGRINEFHSEPSTGKTNLLLLCAREVMQAGGKAMLLDFEDHAEGILQRMQSLGFDLPILPGKFFYLQNPTPDEIQTAVAWAKHNKPTFIGLDGLAEALVAESLSEDKPSDVLTFMRLRVRPFAETGAAVVIADHVTKDPEKRGNWPRGSGAKMGRYDGAVYSTDLIEPYSPGHEGRLRLTIAKDRIGGVGHKKQLRSSLPRGGRISLPVPPCSSA